MKHLLSRTIAVAGAAVALFSVIQAPDDFKRERSGRNDAVKNAFEGKAPPPMAFTGWLNVEKPPKDWAALKGSVILIDFWAHW